MLGVDSTSAGSLAELPGLGGLPLIGNYLQCDFHEFHRQPERWADIYGPVWRMNLGLNVFVACGDLEAANLLLKSDYTLSAGASRWRRCSRNWASIACSRRMARTGVASDASSSPH
jgi:hypothetical protein